MDLSNHTKVFGYKGGIMQNQKTPQQSETIKDVDGQREKNSERKSFIHEKRIKVNPFHRMLKQIAKAALFGAVFGVFAMLCALAIRPLATRFFPSATAIETTVSIATDEPETTNSEEIVESVEETDPVEDIVQSALDSYRYGIEDLEQLMGSVQDLAISLEPALVSIQSVKTATDWFNNPVETSGNCSGIIIADTDTEFVVLAPMNATTDVDSIRVKFYNNVEVLATVKRTDYLSGLCVLAINKEGMEESARTGIQVISLGNSYQIKRGDMVLGLGSPLGVASSSSFGIISYVASNVSVVDGIIRLLYTDADSNIDAGTWFVNTKGELIGWASRVYEDENPKTMIAGISDFKPILERMLNAQASAYVGIYGTNITSQMQNTGISLGVYVTNCDEILLEKG